MGTTTGPHGWQDVATVAALEALAPDAFASLARLRAAAGAHDVDGPRRASPAVADYAEQITVDVASVTDEQRAAAGAVLGDELFGVVQAVWARDVADRLDHAWRQLVGAPTVPAAPAGEPGGPADAGDLWPAIDAFLTAVARLQALDPVLTEVVRLRGARAHDCRLCRSLRSVDALEAGADDGLLDAVERAEPDGGGHPLDPQARVALDLVDAVIWQPRTWPDGLATTVRATFGPAEAVEVVLDVARNGANRIAVALGVDQARVTDGVEYFSMDAAGALTYGLDRPEHLGRPSGPSGRVP